MRAVRLLAQARVGSWAGLGAATAAILGCFILTRIGAGAAILPRTGIADQLLLAAVVGNLVGSAWLAWCCVPASWPHEALAARPLTGWRLGWALGCAALNCWPLALTGPLWSPDLGANLTLTGLGLMGASLLVSTLDARALAAPQVCFALASLMPGLLPRPWNLLLVSERSVSFLVAAGVVFLAGLAAHTVAGSRRVPDLA